MESGFEPQNLLKNCPKYCFIGIAVDDQEDTGYFLQSCVEQENDAALTLETSHPKYLKVLNWLEQNTI